MSVGDRWKPPSFQNVVIDCNYAKVCNPILAMSITSTDPSSKEQIFEP